MASRTLIESGLPILAKIDFLASKIVAGTPQNYSFIVTTVADDTVTTIELFNSETILQNVPDELLEDVSDVITDALLTAYNTIKTGLEGLKTDAESELAALEEPV